MYAGCSGESDLPYESGLDRSSKRIDHIGLVGGAGDAGDAGDTGGVG